MQLVAGEVVVAVLRDGGFELGHAVEVAQEDGTFDTGGIKAIITQFSKEATVAIVNLIRDTSEIADIVIGGTAVDMVYGHTGRYRSSGSHPDGMGSKDLFLMTESICEK